MNATATDTTCAALVVVELDGGHFCDINWSLLGAVARIRDFIALDVDLLIAGEDCEHAIGVARAIPGVRRILTAGVASSELSLAEVVVPWLAKLIDDYSYVLLGATTFGKNLLPGVAALIDNQPVTDVIGIEAADVFVRPLYAGRVVERIINPQSRKLLSIRGSAFAWGPDKHSLTASAPILKIESPLAPRASRFMSEQRNMSGRPELTSARIVVSGGRGLQSRANFQLLNQLADKLGAAVGASRAAVDAGFAENDMQVGQTGKVVAPELYIAVGLSGAVQHIAGMKDSSVVVAINKDPDAPIFQVADYGLVADLFEAIPELIAQL